jgi:hypothetical protein
MLSMFGGKGVEEGIFTCGRAQTFFFVMYMNEPQAGMNDMEWAHDRRSVAFRLCLGFCRLLLFYFWFECEFTSACFFFFFFLMERKEERNGGVCLDMTWCAGKKGMW